jgi:hypothetical protein
MDRFKKSVAVGVLGLMVPLIVGAAVDPITDDGLARTWFKGAGVVGTAAAIAWAARQLEPD